MPRKDPTFTAGDVVRFWCRNLGEDERIAVINFFLFIAPYFYNTALDLNFATQSRIIQRLIVFIRRRLGPTLPALERFSDSLPEIGLQELLLQFNRSDLQYVIDCINDEQTTITLGRRRGRR